MSRGAPPTPVDYVTVTEVPESWASSEQLAMLYTRYYTAAGYCGGKEVLEVACGAGVGLGYLARRAKRVIGGDYSPSLLRLAQEHYWWKVPLLRLDAHALPFRAESVDVVILYEAIYYLADLKRCIGECWRVLRGGGVLLICTANREWPGFNRSPFSVEYCSAAELLALLSQFPFSAQVFGAFPATTGSVMGAFLTALRRLAIALHLIPKTMKGKELLKRLFYGKLHPLPHELEEGLAEPYPLTPIRGDRSSNEYKVLYAVARRV